MDAYMQAIRDHERKRYMVAWKRKNLAAMQADPMDRRHGTRSGYSIGCRCARCRMAARKCMRDYRARKAAESAQTFDNAGR